METSILISKIIGIIYFSFGIGLFFNPFYYQKVFKELFENTSYLILGGILAIIFGVFIIQYHNNWVKNWIVLITIIGWVALLKGILLLAFPTSLTVFKSFFVKKKIHCFFAPILIIFGLVFLYFGFFH